MRVLGILVVIVENQKHEEEAWAPMIDVRYWLLCASAVLFACQQTTQDRPAAEREPGVEHESPAAPAAAPTIEAGAETTSTGETATDATGPSSSPDARPAPDGPDHRLRENPEWIEHVHLVERRGAKLVMRGNSEEMLWLAERIQQEHANRESRRVVAPDDSPAFTGSFRPGVSVQVVSKHGVTRAIVTKVIATCSRGEQLPRTEAILEADGEVGASTRRLRRTKLPLCMSLPQVKPHQQIPYHQSDSGRR